MPPSFCRGCKQPILWREQSNETGHPCDPELERSWVTSDPVTTQQRIMLLDERGHWQFGFIATELTPGAREISGHQSHFATCPLARAFRRRRAP